MVAVKRTDKNYGLRLSGRAGSRPDLEAEYVRRFTGAAPCDVSLRRALEAYARDPGLWDAVLAAQEWLEAVKAKLLAAGYSREDLVKLTLDNS